jgi:hypothetical protein
MICGFCHGAGLRLVFDPMKTVPFELVPCEACTGGVASCCDGMIGGPSEPTNLGHGDDLRAPARR